jgi:hypothetical protein
MGFSGCGNEPMGSVKCWGISWLAKDLLASQERLCSLVLYVCGTCKSMIE